MLIEDPHVAGPDGILVGLLVMSILIGVNERILIRLLISIDGTSASSKASNTQYRGSTFFILKIIPSNILSHITLKF